LKIASSIASVWLSNFFNNYVTVVEFLDSLKIAHITPILEVHNLSSSSKYRPISVLPVLSKALGKVPYHKDVL